MARRLGVETKQRFDIANKSIEVCADILSKPEVQQVTQGLAERALSLLPLLYVPNKIDDIYRVSGRMNDGNGIPYIISYPGEKAKVHRKSKYAIHPMQHNGIREAINEIDGEEQSDPIFERTLGLIIDSYDDAYGNLITTPRTTNEWDAFVYSPSGAIGLYRGRDSSKAKSYAVDTSPIVVGNGKSKSLGEGDVLFHELIHVIQVLNGVVCREGSAYTSLFKRFELEAYRNQVIAQEVHYGVLAEDNPMGWNSMAIEALRRKHNADSEDPYRVTKQLLKEIKDGGWTIN